MLNYKFSSLDTETIHGYAVVLATPYRKWTASSFEECMKPLFLDIKHNKMSARCFMFNITYDVQAIIKYMPYNNLYELTKENHTIYDERYEINYTPNKFCTIKDLKFNKAITFYDIAQFYGWMSLDDASKQYLGDKKIDNKIINNIKTKQNVWSRERMNWYFAEHLNEILMYCQKDAILTVKLAIKVDNKIKEKFNIILRSFASKAVVGERLTLKEVGMVKYTQKDGSIKSYPAYPKFFDNSMSGKYAYGTYKGGIFDVWQRGTFKEVTDIDISSAYPYHMLKMPNWSNGDFITVKNLNEVYTDDYYGWIMATFDYAYIPYRADMQESHLIENEGKTLELTFPNRRTYYPTGERTQTITLLEYRHLIKWGYKPIFHYGYVWRVNPSKKVYPNPFGWIQGIYDEKSHIKADGGKKTYEYQLMKIAMNGAYGKTAQTVGAARMQNFFYASYITAGTRVQIMDFIHSHHLENRVISISTDGILLDGHYEFNKNVLGTGLGSWDVDYYPSALVFGNGTYQLGDGDKRKTKLRGISKDESYQFKELIIKNKDESSIIPEIKPKPVTLNMGLSWKVYTKDDINVFTKRGRHVSCNSDTSKKWIGIKTFNDLLTAKFIGKRFTVNEVDKMIVKAKKENKKIFIDDSEPPEEENDE